MQLLMEDQPLAPAEPPRRRRWPRVLLVMSLLTIVAVVAGVIWLQGRVNPSGGRGGEVEVTIAKGTSTSSIAGLLQRRGVITDAALFRLYLKVKGVGPIQAGRYTFHRHDEMGRVRATLEGGSKADSVRLTIPEGLTLAEIANRIGRLPGRSPARVLEVSRSGELRSQYLPVGFTNLEGLLFPDTYTIPEKDDEPKILAHMLAAFDQVATELGYQDAPTRAGVSAYQAVVVASLVEREAKVDEDRGPIARVIYNRLQRGMPLQVDATVQYARGKQKERLLNRDLEIDSPYNTYRVKGLPPGPIASPGRKALAAALDPPPGPWIYYVLADADGRHAFASTPQEFEKLKAAAHRKGLL